MWVRFFESFEEGILGGFVHGVGGSDDEKVVAGFAIIREGEKFTQLIDANGLSFFGSVGLQDQGMLELEVGSGRYDEDGAAGALSDGGELA